MQLPVQGRNGIVLNRTLSLRGMYAFQITPIFSRREKELARKKRQMVFSDGISSKFRPSIKITRYILLVNWFPTKKYFIIRNQKNISEKISGRKGEENGCIHYARFFIWTARVPFTAWKRTDSHKIIRQEQRVKYIPWWTAITKQ